MVLQTDSVISAVAKEMHIPEETLVRQGARALLERRLRQIKADLFDLTSRYGVSSVEAMEARYREGTLEEADSWRDLQRLDHLEFERDRLLQLLESLK